MRRLHLTRAIAFFRVLNWFSTRFTSLGRSLERIGVSADGAAPLSPQTRVSGAVGETFAARHKRRCTLQAACSTTRGLNCQSHRAGGIHIESQRSDRRPRDSLPEKGARFQALEVGRGEKDGEDLVCREASDS